MCVPSCRANKVFFCSVPGVSGQEKVSEKALRLQCSKMSLFLPKTHINTGPIGGWKMRLTLKRQGFRFTGALLPLHRQGSLSFKHAVYVKAHTPNTQTHTHTRKHTRTALLTLHVCREFLNSTNPQWVKQTCWFHNKLHPVKIFPVVFKGWLCGDWCSGTIGVHIDYWQTVRSGSQIVFFLSFNAGLPLCIFILQYSLCIL